MKLLSKLLSLIVLVSAFTGCMGVGDDVSGCVWDENTRIVFKYTDSNGADVFPASITSVDAFIFDKDQRFVAQKRMEKTELDQKRAWEVGLPAGDYYAVCWGNMSVNSKFNGFVKGETTLDDCIIKINADLPGAGDPIYYAPSKTHPNSRSASPFGTRVAASDLTQHAFSVVQGQTVVKEMPFVVAHLTVNVYIVGASVTTNVTGTQLWSEYDFLFTTKSHQQDYTESCVSTEYNSTPAQMATFYSGFGEITDNINFIVKKASDGSVLETVNLKQFLAANPTARQGNEINILITFSDMGVTVTVPQWDDKPVTPGI